MDTLSAFAKTNTAARIRAAASRGALSHALILSGAGARDDAARYAACAYECSAPGQKPCLTCAHCRKVLAGIHPDVIYVRDEEHREIAVDVVRDMRADAFIRPNEGARKVYVFEDCALLTEKDQNVLLKIVEEGPPYAAFLFCAENPAALLPTIRSRCVELKLMPSAGEEDDASARAGELCRLIAEGSAADRAAFFAGLESAKLRREELGALLAEARVLLSDALTSLYGAQSADDARALAQNLTRRLTKSQILGTIDILQTYQIDCTYNVGAGILLGGLAAQLEELF